LRLAVVSLAAWTLQCFRVARKGADSIALSSRAGTQPSEDARCGPGYSDMVDDVSEYRYCANYQDGDGNPPSTLSFKSLSDCRSECDSDSSCTHFGSYTFADGELYCYIVRDCGGVLTDATESTDGVAWCKALHKAPPAGDEDQQSEEDDEGATEAPATEAPMPEHDEKDDEGATEAPATEAPMPDRDEKDDEGATEAPATEAPMSERDETLKWWISKSVLAWVLAHCWCAAAV